MNGLVLVTGMQEGYVEERTRPLATEIANTLSQLELPVAFAKFVNRPESNFVEILDWHELQSPDETAIVSELDQFRTDTNTFIHHTYSALTADGMQRLVEEESGTLYLCGIDTDATILDTAFHAFNAGYNVQVLQDLCDSRAGADAHRAGLQILERTIGQVIDSDEII